MPFLCHYSPYFSIFYCIYKKYINFHQFDSEILQDMTMNGKLMFPIEDKQNHPFCRLKILVRKVYILLI